MKRKGIDAQRRSFIRRCLAASVGSAAWLGFGSAMGLASAALKQTRALPGYRALVCLYLDGGNDSYNMLVPTGTSEYSNYSAVRGNLALNLNQLLALNGTSHGLHPAMPRMAARYNQGQVAFVNNVGTLIQPTTASQYHNGSVPLPAQLFSHSDQSKQWELTAADSQTAKGWLGRAADLLQSFNSSLIPMNITLADLRTLQVGNGGMPYALAPSGLEDFRHRWGVRGPDRHAAYMALQQLGYGHPMMQQFSQTHQDTLAIYDELSADLATVPDIPNASEYPSGERLARQLQMVARVILSQAPKAGVNRQIFMVRMGGHDLHDNLLSGQQELLGVIDQCVDAFFNTLASPQWGGLQDNVTLFSLSEFARTLTSNGDGSDHGWGGVQFVLGGAVQGGMYGSYPDLALNGPQNIDPDRGRLVPNLAVEQYAATLVRWMGVADADLPLIFPNLGNFPTGNLGFMA